MSYWNGSRGWQKSPHWKCKKPPTLIMRFWCFEVGLRMKIGQIYMIYTFMSYYDIYIIIYIILYIIIWIRIILKLLEMILLPCVVMQVLPLLPSLFKERWRAERLEATCPGCWSWLQEGTPEVRWTEATKNRRHSCLHAGERLQASSMSSALGLPGHFHQRVQVNVEVSWNGGTPWYPQISHFNEGFSIIKHPAIGVFPYPHLRNPPYVEHPCTTHVLPRHIFFSLLSSPKTGTIRNHL